jgi:hypothetical protein
MAQRKYMEGLRWLLGIVRSPQEIVRVCEQKQPQNSRSYGEALSNWKHVNKAIIDFIEQRWLLVTGLRSEGNIVLQAAMERSLNGFVAEQVARGFFKDGQDTCSNLANYFESDYFNMRSSFHSSWMPLVAAPAPAQIESWYKE